MRRTAELSGGLDPAITCERINFHDVAALGKVAQQGSSIMLRDAEALGLQARRDFRRCQWQQMTGKTARTLQDAAASFPSTAKAETACLEPWPTIVPTILA